MSIAMYQESGSGPLQECRSRCAKRVDVDHFRKVYCNVPKRWKSTTVEKYIVMYQNSGSRLMQKCRLRCTKTVEVDKCRNVDRDVPKQWKWTNAEM
ncbi:hypothetical protein PoB_005704400 [Plakobranchus ocellatus]|uniref:Uncharacterized protein n=1 Tax=Plakobranchus ocellatus TaxID=259542 RepID=A0AAV4CI94_9GAST|nr:hypothetical protein PoB_005704400 [Plakobranchus ocellatus]